MGPKRVFLSLGSNLGNREKNLERAVAALQSERVHVTARSSLYETEPQDVSDQPWFLNMVLACETSYFPMQLLAILHRVERDLGRTRTGAPPRGPRAIDIDIVLFGTAVIDTSALTIPHPRMNQRRFVLEPMLEIDPDLRDPRDREKLSKKLGRLNGQVSKKLGAAAQSPGPACDPERS